MGSARDSTATISKAAVVNFAGSAALLFANKALYALGFHHAGTLLTVLHFVFISFALEAARRFGLFEHKHLPWRQVLPLSAAFCGFVAFHQLSFVYSSVGFYYFIKVFTLPLLVFIRAAFFAEDCGLQVTFALMIATLGTGVATITDIDFNVTGVLVGLCSLVVTCVYQIWVGTLQRALGCTAVQLMYHHAPMAALMLLPTVPMMDDVAQLRTHLRLDPTVLGILCLSAALALGVHLSTFVIIGKSSPIEYNVLGHFKIAVALMVGFVVFGKAVDWRTVAAAAVTLSGVAWFSYLKVMGVR